VLHASSSPSSLSTSSWRLSSMPASDGRIDESPPKLPPSSSSSAWPASSSSAATSISAASSHSAPATRGIPTSTSTPLPKDGERDGALEGLLEGGCHATPGEGLLDGGCRATGEASSTWRPVASTPLGLLWAESISRPRSVRGVALMVIGGSTCKLLTRPPIAPLPLPSLPRGASVARPEHWRRVLSRRGSPTNARRTAMIPTAAMRMTTVRPRPEDESSPMTLAADSSSERVSDSDGADGGKGSGWCGGGSNGGTSEESGGVVGG